MTMSESLGEITIQTVAMPGDTNPDGDIFGGWLLSQMDLAAGVLAKRIAQSRVVTVAIDSMSFHAPVHVGDLVYCYVKALEIGNTSLKLRVEAWAEQLNNSRQKVTEGIFTFVALDPGGIPWKVKRD